VFRILNKKPKVPTESEKMIPTYFTGIRIGDAAFAQLINLNDKVDF